MTATDDSTDVTILRDARETAARQRERLALGAGRSRAAAALQRIPLVARAATSEAAARSGLRYQPVAWTAISLVAIAWWFPGRHDAGQPTAAAAVPAPFATTTTIAAPSATSEVPAITSPPVALQRPASPPISTTRPAPSGGTTSPATPPTTSPAPTSTAPLTVRGFGWASRLSGTGVSAAEVPEGSMPVANRLGQLDKASFVRLSGGETTLRLSEVEEGAREAIGAGTVMACPITTADWQEAPDQSFDDAPAWDATTCVAGVEDDGVWTFDLSGLDVDGDAGFALVPDPSGPADFQVTFAAR